MTRTHLWQLGAIAAAAGLLCVAQAQTSTEAQATNESVMADAWATPEKWSDTAPTEAVVLAVIQADAAATPATEPPASTESITTASSAQLAPKNSQPLAVSAPPASAMAAIVAPAALVEPPITREEVIAEAIYANQNGLIPRGEMSVVNEDKGTHWVEQADQARLARAEQVRLARVEAYQQRLARAASPAPAETGTVPQQPPVQEPQQQPQQQVSQR